LVLRINGPILARFWRETDVEKLLVKVEWRGDVAVVIADNPPVNAISRAVRAALLGAFQALAREGRARAVVLRGQGKTFFAGADIREFDAPPQPPHLQDVLDAIEAMPVPVVAALHGAALGGGLEAALACHYRIAAPGTKMGLPEIHLGIFPGAGGTQRLPRLVPLERACQIILTGKPLGATEALKDGLLDEIAEENLNEAALAFTEKLLKEQRGPRPVSKMPPQAGSDVEAVFTKWHGFAAARLKGRVSPLKALTALRAAMERPFAEGLKIERALNLECKQAAESKALRHVFFAERETRKVPGLDPKTNPLPVKRVGVLGAGTMGSGIAVAFANAGLPVTLVEENQAALARGLVGIGKIYADSAAKGRLSAEEAERRKALIQGALALDALTRADLVVEAVFEDLALKKAIFAKLGKLCAPSAVLTTNTSSLDVDAIAAASGRPERALGLHFFSPANVMPLLEVVRGAKTSPQVLQTALTLAKAINKIPVVSGVGFGFIGNRMLLGYGREAQRMLLEGATPREVDSVLEDFGFAMGVLAVYDLAGIDVGVKVREQNRERLSSDPTFFKAAGVLYEAGRYGQKNGKGFYRYDENRKRHDDAEAAALIAKAAKGLGIRRRDLTREEILERCLLPLINEGAKILEEGIALRASDIDVVWTYGYGFPRHKGGPMFHADRVGLDVIVVGLEKYRKIYGDEFWTPAPLLQRRASENKTFANFDAERA
jgi:3-hydroxyacyl-CoA dehydrogenase